MFKPLSFSLILVVALCACSKKDDSARSNVQSPPVNASDPSKDTPVTADKTDPGSKTPPPASRAEPASKGTEADKGPSKEAVIPAEEKDTKQKKPVEKAAHGSAKKGTESAMRRRWDQFQAAVNGCDTKTGSAREECLAKATDTFRAANFKCEALGPKRRTNCLQIAERWNSPVAEAPGAPVKHAEEPAVTATDPGDPRPAERNRDSTKQH